MVTLRFEDKEIKDKKIKFICFNGYLNITIFEDDKTKWIDLKKSDAKQIISFLQNHFNL